MRFKGLVLTCLALTVPCALGDTWSWGNNPSGPSPPSSTGARSLDTTPVIPLSRNAKFLSSHPSNDAKEIPKQEADTAPRFLGLGDKLCSIGIGTNCKKPHLARPNSLQGVGRPGVPLPGAFPAPSINHNSYPPPINQNAFGPPLHQQQNHLPVHPSPHVHDLHPSPHVHDAKEPTVVHHHTHTHIHHTPGADVHPVPHPHENINHGGFQPSPGFHNPEPLFRPLAPVYREECMCVHASFCSSYDVIARSSSPNDISNLLDARSRNPDVKSNSTDAEEEENRPHGTSTEKSSTSRLGNSFSAHGASSAGNRTRRDTLTGGHHASGHHASGHPASGHHPSGHPTSGLHVSGHPEAVNVTSDAEGRTLRYTPGQAGCGAAYVCCRNPQLNQARHQPACGQPRSSGIVGRVANPHYVNGDTEFGEYPWHVAILDVNGVYISGGALIDERHVLTAAHSIDNINPQQMVIRIGDWDVSGQHEFYPHVEISVAFLVIHPEFYAGNLQNDIAVIRLQSYVDFNAYPHISPICLPDPQAYSYFVGKRCYSTGWGKDAFGDQGQFQTILKEVELPVVEHRQCEAALRQTRLGYQFSLHQGMLCAGGEQGKDTCQGDGGGPLVCQGPDGSLQLAGLVSWGIGCGQYGVPGVYVNVGHYTQWIYTITRAP
ncbi:uncharacterized protein [Palaemon carinicauda]|uniref:uncharacterized protein n=1 Tax=Palaemon carinicauda TaxID=392227 RepID=UPI0035B65BF1